MSRVKGPTTAVNFAPEPELSNKLKKAEQKNNRLQSRNLSPNEKRKHAGKESTLASTTLS